MKPAAHPDFHGLRQLSACRCVKKPGMVAGHFPEYRDIPGQNGHTLMGRLDQRQAKAFIPGRRQQPGGTRIKLLQAFIADARQPAQPRVALRVAMQPLYQPGDGAAVFDGPQARDREQVFVTGRVAPPAGAGRRRPASL